MSEEQTTTDQNQDIVESKSQLPFQGTTGWEYRAIQHEDGTIKIHSCSVFNDVIDTVDSVPVDFENIKDIDVWVNEINWSYKALTKPILNMKAEEI